MVKILLLQFGLSTAVAVLFWGANGNVSGYSAALGGLICVLPNAFLATRLAMPRNPEAERPLMRAAFAGELGKLALTVAMFAGAFALVRPLAAGALFAGFIAGQFGTFAGLWLAKTDTRRMDDTSNKHGE